jgi:hypothetical protein
MLGSLGTVVKFSFLIAIASVFFIASTVYAIKVFYRAFSSGVVQIGKFPDLANNTVDRAPYLLARAEALAVPVPLDALYEVKVPPLATRFGAKDDLKFLDDVKINIQGVSLPEVIKNLFAALPDDQPIVSAEPEAVGSGSGARLEWKEPSGKKKTWLLRSDKPPTDADATREIIDQAIYEMVYYMHYDPTRPGPPEKGVQFPNERALEAYYAGQQHLSQYQRKRGIAEIAEGLKDLDEAERRFRILYQEMPNFNDGLMLLGVTLLEQKNEPEAIIIFDRVKKNLFDQGVNNLKSEEKKALFSAMLFQATAQRKLYRVKNNHQALAEIGKITDQVAPLHVVPTPNTKETDAQKADRLDFLKIHISVLAEKAYVLGAYLILLNEVNFIEGLTTHQQHAPQPVPPVHSPQGGQPQPAAASQPAPIDPPPPVVVDDDQRATNLLTIERKIKAGGPDAEQAKKDRLAAYRAEMKRIYEAHKVVVQHAKELINGVGANDDAWKGISARFLSDLGNAVGYAQYRYAQAMEDVKDDDDAFLSQCKAALDTLHEAYAMHQNEQTILLNMGLIESDPRCDPDGENIERARSYLKQASQIKPTDYYSQQLLATLDIRELYTWGPLAKPEVLTDAVAAAEKARTLRPEDGTICALLAQAYILKWAAQATDDATRNDLRLKIEAAVSQAEKRKATPVHQDTVRLQWLLAQATRAPDDQFDDLKAKLGAAIDKAIVDARDDRTWYGYRLAKDANALKSAVDALTKGKQSTLHWPN